MRIAIRLLLAVVVLAAAWLLIIPANTFLIFRRPGGGRVSVSRTSVEFLPAPDRYKTGAFDHLEGYVRRLMVPSPKKRFLSMFTTAGDRGFALHATDSIVEAHLTVEWRQEPKREAAIRSFFETRGVLPTEDYLAGNGGVPDATRLLAYPLSGGPGEVAAVTKSVLEDLCGISAVDAMDIGYSER